jgi:hypothetical protein
MTVLWRIKNAPMATALHRSVPYRPPDNASRTALNIEWQLTISPDFLDIPAIVFREL